MSVTSLQYRQKTRGEGYAKEKNCTSMFTGAFLTVAKRWKQRQCPLTDEWIKKMYSLLVRLSLWTRSQETWVMASGKMRAIVISCLSYGTDVRNK